MFQKLNVIVCAVTIGLPVPSLANAATLQDVSVSSFTGDRPGSDFGSLNGPPPAPQVTP